ncbi:MAG: FixH family protein [Rubritepida sp.]|jgi:nitrogen fixation protein FixH|nr:FixH family protein [Rubritepida sp.]
MSAHHPAPRSGWIPWVFVGGMLLVVVVNGVMVFFALSTFTGLTTRQSYDRGRAYNQVLAEAARQDALGWTALVALEGGRLRPRVTDREGRAVEGLLEAELVRPIEGTRVALGAASPRAGFDLPELRAGQWEFRATFTDAQGRQLDIRQRLLLP